MDWWDNRNAELQKLLDILSSKPEPPEDPDASPEIVPVTPDEAPKLASQIPAGSPQVPCYTPAKLKQSVLNAEDFLLPRYAAGIRKKLEAVIQAEAPVSENLLIKRVVQSYGITRTGSRIQKYMDGILASMDLLTTSSEDRRFYWRADQDPTTYDQYRLSVNDEDRRDAKDIPVQEAAAALCRVLYEQVSMGREDLIREAAKAMGFARLGTAVTALLTDAIAYAGANNRITTDTNGKYILI
jgi:hypothetical protein